MDIKKIRKSIILFAALASFVSLKVEIGILWLIIFQLIEIDEKLGEKNGTTD